MSVEGRPPAMSLEGDTPPLVKPETGAVPCACSLGRYVFLQSWECPLHGHIDNTPT